MNIILSIYKSIVKSVPDVPPEIGGILGGNDNIIRYVKFDKGLYDPKKKHCAYIPDVKKLNEYIEEWENNYIDFYGIFHTHFYGIETLSSGDKNYIKKIMDTLPLEVNELYFPVVVLPERKIKGYIAYRKGTQIHIMDEKLIIVNEVN